MQMESSHLKAVESDVSRWTFSTQTNGCFLTARWVAISSGCEFLSWWLKLLSCRFRVRLRSGTCSSGDLWFRMGEIVVVLLVWCWWLLSLLWLMCLMLLMSLMLLLLLSLSLWFSHSNSTSRVQQYRGCRGTRTSSGYLLEYPNRISYINLPQDLGVQHTRSSEDLVSKYFNPNLLEGYPWKKSPPNHDKWMKAATVQLRAQGPFIIVYPCQPCVFSHLLWKVCAIWSRWGSAQHDGTQRSSRIPSISTSRSFWSTILRCPRTAESLIITSWGFQVEILLV